MKRSGPLKRKTLPCPVCGSQFVSYGLQKTCSMACKIAKGMKAKRRTCIQCGAEFITTRPASSKRFCTKKCHEQFQRKPREFMCEQCGKKFVRGSIGGRNRRFCSKECQFKGHRGESNSLWRGDRRMERGKTWPEARDAARKRDRRCMATGCDWSFRTAMERLSVDHIVPFRLAKKYIDTDGIDPNHLDNLACLCRAHHARKTRIEDRLLRGDIIGFRSAMNALMPIELVDKALEMWKLNTQQTVRG